MCDNILLHILLRSRVAQAQASYVAGFPVPLPLRAQAQAQAQALASVLQHASLLVFTIFQAWQRVRNLQSTTGAQKYSLATSASVLNRCGNFDLP